MDVERHCCSTKTCRARLDSTLLLFLEPLCLSVCMYPLCARVTTLLILYTSRMCPTSQPTNRFIFDTCQFDLLAYTSRGQRLKSAIYMNKHMSSVCVYITSRLRPFNGHCELLNPSLCLFPLCLHLHLHLSIYPSVFPVA